LLSGLTKREKKGKGICLRGEWNTSISIFKNRKRT